MPPARQPRPAAGRDRGLRAAPLPPDRADPAARRRDARQLRHEAALGQADRDHARPRQEQETTLGGRQVLLYPLYHPAAALYTPAMLEVLEQDFARLPELLGPVADEVPDAEPESRSRARARPSSSASSSLYAHGSSSRPLAGGDRGARRAPRGRARAGRRRHRRRRARHRARRRSCAEPAARSASTGPSRARRSRSATATAAGSTSPTSTSTASPGVSAAEWGDLEPYFDGASASSSGRRPAGRAPAAPRFERHARSTPAETDRPAASDGAGRVLILAFDTATDVATSALVGDGEVLGERHVAAGHACSRTSTRSFGAAACGTRSSRRIAVGHRAGKLHRPAHRPRDRARPRLRARRRPSPASRRSTRSPPARPARCR